MNIKCPFPSVLVNFGLKSILLDIKIANPAFLGSFYWKTFFHYLYSKAMPVFGVEECFFHAEVGWIHSVSLCLFVGKLRSLILRDSNEKLLCILAILVAMAVVVVAAVVCVCVFFPFFSFVGVRLFISCIYMGVVSFPGLEFSF